MHVTIYTKADCPYCTKAKMLLSSKGMNYNELKLGEDFTRDTLLETFPSAKTFPVIVIDGYNIGGYTQLVEKLNTQTNDSQKFLTEG